MLRHDEGWPEGLDDTAQPAVLETLRRSGIRLAGASELSIVLTDDEEQQALNRQWRGIDKSTNVLSFPQVPPGGPFQGLLGDITLARETVAREATEQDVTFGDHFTHLVVHGFLHILGYDHLTDEEALAMEGLETQILKALGITDPYAGDRGDSPAVH